MPELSHQKQVLSLIGPDLRRMLEEAKDPEQARELLEDFHPEDLADLLHELENEDAAEILRLLPEDLAAPIFERLEEGTQSEIIELLGPKDAADIAAEMAPDERADLLEQLPEDVGDKLLEQLEQVDPQAAAETEHLLRFAEGSAGAIMTTEYLAVGPERTVLEAIALIREKGAEAETIHYLFVTNDNKRLEGVLSLRDVLLAEPVQRISDVMTTRVITVGPETDQEEVARQMSKYDIVAIPVVDKYQTMVGVITADDVMDVLTEEGTEDAQKLGGMDALDASYWETDFLTFIRKRGSWLVVLFIEEFFTGTALRHYDEVLSAVGKLALYLPLLISTGGNSGSQSATLIIRGMAVGEIKLSDWWRIGVRELGMGLVLGALLATVGVVRVLMWHDGIRIAGVIAITIIGIVTMGCVVGSMLPLLMRRLGFDPATSSTPFIASLVDVLGIIIYFNVAKLLLANVIAEAVRQKAMGH